VQVAGVARFCLGAHYQGLFVGQLDDFHTAVLATQQRVAVIGNRARCPGALVIDGTGRDAGLQHDLAHGLGAALGQLLVEIGIAHGIAVANDQQATCLRLLGGGLLVGGGRLGIHLRQLGHGALAVGGQLVGASGEHPGVFDLGHQARLFRDGGHHRSRGNGQLLGGDLQVLFLGDAVKLLQARLPDITGDAPQRAADCNARQDAVLAFKGITGSAPGDNPDTTEHGHAVVPANVFNALGNIVDLLAAATGSGDEGATERCEAKHALHCGSLPKQVWMMAT